MKIVGICGSHRKRKNTFTFLQECLNASKADTEIIHISDLCIEPCRACYDLCSDQPYRCIIDDDLQNLFQKMIKADGIILASPLYSPVLVPSRLAMLTERLSCVHFFESARGRDRSPLLGKPCGIITVSSESDPMNLLKLLANFVLMLHLDLVTMVEYPYFGVWAKSPVEDHEAGKKCAQQLGVSMANRIKMRNSSHSQHNL